MTEIEVQARILSARFRKLLAGIRKERPVLNPKKRWQKRSNVPISRHPGPRPAQLLVFHGFLQML